MSAIPAILICIGFSWQALAGASNPEFGSFPARRSVETCKDLDFTSYHRANDQKKRLMRENPERSKPNYGGKYLILKQEFLMETQWLIADCETGKFFKEALTGNVVFKPDSLLAIVSKPKSEDAPRYMLWSGEEWSQIDAPASQATSAVVPRDFQTQYGGLYSKYSVAAQDQACKELDFNSFFRAQGAKKTIVEMNPDRSKPNFAGRFLLLKYDVLFERLWLIADCATGKFFPTFLKDNLEFRPDSALVLIKHSSEFPRLNVWKGDRFVEVLNPVRTGKQVVENKVYDEDAMELWNALGAGKRDSKVSFEELKCTETNCSVRIFPDKEPRTLPPEQAKRAESILKKWGGELTDGEVTAWSIQEGKCTRGRNNPVCEIQLSR